jgi:L-fuconolactonase
MSDQPRRGAPPHFHVDEDWLALHTEDVLEPELPIVDAHHHLWAGYLVPDLLKDLRCGHNFRGTVYVEAAYQYRTEGDPRFASVGEVEYANRVGAEFATGVHGAVQACAGIVGRVDLSQGASAEEVLQACIQAAPERFRGIRHMVAWDAHPDVSKMRTPPPPDLLLDKRFREGISKLGPLGLSYDTWCYHPQLPQLLDLADAFPDTTIVINHTGGRLVQGPYAAKPDDTFQAWKASMRELGQRPNVFVKLGGLSMRLFGFTFIDREVPPSSDDLAPAWTPIIDTCIEAFGPGRSMFESNFSTDKGGVSARVVWNAFKRITKGYSDDERAQLFAGTAIRAYRLPAALGHPG